MTSSGNRFDALQEEEIDFDEEFEDELSMDDSEASETGQQKVLDHSWRTKKAVSFKVVKRSKQSKAKYKPRMPDNTQIPLFLPPPIHSDQD
jgi:hypothetical protein